MTFQETFNERVIPAANRAFGVLVTLKRGAAATDEFTAQWEHRVYEVIDAHGFPTRVESRDFMFPVDAVVLNGRTVEPRSGDTITVTENGTECVYEVNPLGTTPAVEFMAGRYRYRVRTKRVN